MPVLDQIAGYSDELTAWRRHIHAHPELGFDCHETAKFVIDKLERFGVDEIHSGIATTGIVGIINGRGAGRTIGLRADMDALPMPEDTGVSYASTRPGRMHACGHDGHTTMLLGAARYLAETRNFSGRVALIFQPAEEGGGGGRVMCQEGVMDRFEIAEVYALHTSPWYEAGTFHTAPGPVMAAVDEFAIEITGKGGHASQPQRAIDPVAAALQVGQAIQTVVSRNINALDQIVVSLTEIHAGTAHNVIPNHVSMGGTIRSYNPEARGIIHRRLAEICDGMQAAMGVTISLRFPESLPSTVNHPAQVEMAARACRSVVSPDSVDTSMAPRTGAEDFSYMLQERPGAFVFIGQGIGPGVHNPAFDFNDEIAPIGASFFATLVEQSQPLSNQV
ncbi:MAG: M20 aminoacylase family protein [Pseudomonadota bacterium]